MHSTAEQDRLMPTELMKLSTMSRLFARSGAEEHQRRRWRGTPRTEPILVSCGPPETDLEAGRAERYNAP